MVGTRWGGIGRSVPATGTDTNASAGEATGLYCGSPAIGAETDADAYSVGGYADPGVAVLCVFTSVDFYVADAYGDSS